jgi:two-component system, NarL family, response regulator
MRILMVDDHPMLRGGIAAVISNKEIANRMHVSEETAKSHVSNILSKLGARDRTQAVVIAARRGIIDILNGTT